ncbi:hypothetical protein TNCV_451301 [Trichonephila clavipes]|nr:hypothetical protein TNCV_451301 [Trichonephila clavipes]
MPLLKSRPGFSTFPSSFLIGRITKVCTRPSDSLVPYWWGPNNRSLRFFLNAPEPNDSSTHLGTLSTTSSFFLCSKSSIVFRGISLPSQTGPVNCHITVHCYVYYGLPTYWCFRPDAKQWTMTPVPRELLQCTYLY